MRGVDKGMAVESGRQEGQYALSCEVLGHSEDVRAVACLQLAGHGRQHIVTGSRDGTACVWKPDPVSKTEYLLEKVIRKHTGYVSALCIIPQDTQAGRPQGKCGCAFYLIRTTRCTILINAHHIHSNFLVCGNNCNTQTTCFAALLATGSQDSTILVHSLAPEVEEPLERYTGHQSLVTTITHQHGQLVSGSWDRCVYLCVLQLFF